MDTVHTPYQVMSYNTLSPSRKLSRLLRDYKIDNISLNTHKNRFKFKSYITNIYINIFGVNQLLIIHYK